MVSGVCAQFRAFKRSSTVQEGDVRLAASRLSFGGRVEIFHAGQWGTVCDDGWDLDEAHVVCRQLKFPRALSVMTGGEGYYDKPASGPIWMDDMKCKGTEKYLHACTFKGWGITDCTHKEDVVIQCDAAGYMESAALSSYPLDHSINLSDELGEVFSDERFCDLSITAQSSLQDQEDTTLHDSTTLCAHKVVLSQVHAFNITQETQNITVQIASNCLPHFSSFIRYLYTRKMEVSFSSVQCLHWLASQFGVEQLMRDTGLLFNQIIPDDSSFETQVSIYEYALETKDLQLQEMCIRYLVWNFENFTMSPLWTRISEDLLSGLLHRSDLVVQDELFVLQAVENWISSNDNTSLDKQAKLLSLVRFPMIPAEQLTDSQMTLKSLLYSTHKDVFNDCMLKALQFNVQLLTNIISRGNMSIEDVFYQPRIYTSALWALSFDKLNQGRIRSQAYGDYNYNYNYNDGRTKAFNVPYHSSTIFKDREVSWSADIFVNQYECSNRGIRCQSLPMARFLSHNSNQFPGVVFRNRLLLMCENRYICEVQDFKDNNAFIPNNGSQSLTYPCPNDQYKFIFVARPEYI
ncbi:unnamed protein product [Knipowitschia caucasica]